MRSNWNKNLGKKNGKKGIKTINFHNFPIIHELKKVQFKRTFHFFILRPQDPIQYFIFLVERTCLKNLLI